MRLEKLQGPLGGTEEDDFDLGGGQSPRARGKRSSEEIRMRKHDPIEAALRRLHDQVVAEPLPDDFLELLDRIDRKRSEGE